MLACLTRSVRGPCSRHHGRRTGLIRRPSGGGSQPSPRQLRQRHAPGNGVSRFLLSSIPSVFPRLDLQSTRCRPLCFTATSTCPSTTCLPSTTHIASSSHRPQQRLLSLAAMQWQAAAGAARRALRPRLRTARRRRGMRQQRLGRGGRRAVQGLWATRRMRRMGGLLRGRAGAAMGPGPGRTAGRQQDAERRCWGVCTACWLRAGWGACARSAVALLHGACVVGRRAMQCGKGGSFASETASRGCQAAAWMQLQKGWVLRVVVGDEGVGRCAAAHHTVSRFEAAGRRTAATHTAAQRAAWTARLTSWQQPSASCRRRGPRYRLSKSQGYGRRCRSGGKQQSCRDRGPHCR